MLYHPGKVHVGNIITLVQIYYSKRQYQKAIDELKGWLRMRNDLPVKARVAMAACYYHLGQYEMAEACFKRILQIDPKCVDGLLGMAVISEKI
jgi:tetratricopeptide (TPR) repeat protein